MIPLDIFRNFKDNNKINNKIIIEFENKYKTSKINFKQIEPKKIKKLLKELTCNENLFNKIFNKLTDENFSQILEELLNNIENNKEEIIKILFNKINKDNNNFKLLYQLIENLDYYLKMDIRKEILKKIDIKKLNLNTLLYLNHLNNLGLIKNELYNLIIDYIEDELLINLEDNIKNKYQYKINQRLENITDLRIKILMENQSNININSENNFILEEYFNNQDIDDLIYYCNQDKSIISNVIEEYLIDSSRFIDFNKFIKSFKNDIKKSINIINFQELLIDYPNINKNKNNLLKLL